MDQFSFHLSLIIVGSLILLGLALHSIWSWYKNTPRQATPQKKREPAFAANSSGLAAKVNAAENEPGVLAAKAASAIKPSVQDALIDVLTQIELEAPISGDAALAVMPTTRRIGSKPFSIEGLHAESGQWEQIRSGQRYSAFQSGIQMANRTGCMNDIEFSEYAVKTQHFSDAIDGAVALPEMQQEVARARELDLFASQHDAQLSFTLLAKDLPWSPGFVQQNAARLGFSMGNIPGRMILMGAGPVALPILSLSFDSQAALEEDPNLAVVRKVVLTLDVPQVPSDQEPFPKMCQLANDLAQSMEAALIDDNENPLSDKAFQAIAQDIQKLYQSLELRDLAAGSPQARRLFS